MPTVCRHMICFILLLRALISPRQIVSGKMSELPQFAYAGLQLYSTQNEFYFVAETADSALKIDKESVSFEVISAKNVPYTSVEKEPTGVVAFLGIVDLVACPYLAVAVESELVGYVDGDKPIHRVVKTDLIPFSKSLSHLTPIQVADNTKFIEMVRSMISIPELYYSASYDITHTMQRLQGTGPQFLNAPLVNRADLRYICSNYFSYFSGERRI